MKNGVRKKPALRKSHYYVLYFIRHATDRKLWAHFRDGGQGVGLFWGPKSHAQPFETWFDAHEEIECRDLESHATVEAETHV
jgi:hypothetical protein